MRPHSDTQFGRRIDPVYAFRYGKAIVVSPLTNAGAPLITAVLSIMLLGTAPTATKLAGIAFALFAAVLLAIEPEPAPTDANAAKKAAAAGGSPPPRHF